jgi:hypothetical protein
MPTKSAEFTANGSWTAPARVYAVHLTMIGGGAGATTSGATPCGGAGAAEMCTNRRVPVTPGTTYSVVIGGKGLGATVRGTQPTPPGNSSFAGFIALGAGPYGGTVGAQGQPQWSGNGGGVGGGSGQSAGGTWNGPYGFGGVYYLPIREACGWWGGGAGGGGYPSYANPVQGLPGTTNGPDFRVGTGTGHGGLATLQGRWLHSTNGNAYGGGGAGATTIWGGGNPNGGDGPITDHGGGTVTISLPLACYGAGTAGGSGNNAFAITDDPGGNGAPGYVLLLWEE